MATSEPTKFWLVTLDTDGNFQYQRFASEPTPSELPRAEPYVVLSAANGAMLSYSHREWWKFKGAWKALKAPERAPK